MCPYEEEDLPFLQVLFSIEIEKRDGRESKLPMEIYMDPVKANLMRWFKYIFFSAREMHGIYLQLS
jgi:hypothetical protein